MLAPAGLQGILEQRRLELLLALRGFMGMVTDQEQEVACVAHYMGYELMRFADGYVLARKYGAQSEVVIAPTLKEITEHLKH